MSDERLSDDWFERALEADDDRDGERGDDERADGREGDEPGEDGERGDDETRPDAPPGGTPEDDSPLEFGGDIDEGDVDIDDDAIPLEPGEGGESVGDDSLFEEDFSEALSGVDVPGEGGLGAGPAGFDDVDFGLGGTSDTDFDEDFDSDLPRIDLGIDGLDGMIQGGIPERSLMVAMGSAGTGKTTFGLQFLAHGLEQGENAVFITLEESRERVVHSAVEKGYPFDEYADEGRLAVVDVDPIEMANSLASIRSELPALIEGFDASRLVLDSVSLLEMMYDDRAKRRNEIYDFTRSLKAAGVTAMLTSEASDENAYASRYGIVEYLTDAVFVLQYIRPNDFRETRLAIEIQKIRDANHSRETKPYEITGEGISVHQQANLF